MDFYLFLGTTKDLQQLKSCIKEALYSKRASSLTDRYEVLMADCLQRYDDDMIREGGFDAPPINTSKMRRGKPKKSELEYSSKYGIIYPVIAVLQGGMAIRTEVTPRLLAEWRANEEKHLKAKSYEELVLMENEKIDWGTVANKMVKLRFYSGVIFLYLSYFQIIRRSTSYYQVLF